MKNLKKLFSICAFCLTIALSAGFFVGCAGDTIELSSNHITLEYTAVEYDGTEKKPAVKVIIDEEEISADEYTVEYSKNINVGTASVKVVAKEDSNVITGSVNVGFEITEAVSTAATYSELSAGLESANFSGVTLTQDVVIASDKTLVVPEGKTLTIGEKTLTIEGTLENEGTIITNKLIVVDGTFENDGEYVVNVDTYAELLDATYKATKIVLTENLVGSNGDYEILANSEVGDLNLVLDLNGKSIENCIYIVAKDNAKMNLTIKNGTVFSRDENWAIAIKSKAQTKGDVVIKVEDVVAYAYHSGIQTNGSADQKNIILEAKNCTFGVANGSDYGYEMTRAGGYFPGLHYYRFENCDFVGQTGVYAKSGYQKFINCTINGEKSSYDAPVHDGNGWVSTGSALVVDSSESYQAPVEVEIDGGTLSSEHGFAVEEIITYENQAIESYSEITYKNNPSMTAGDGKDAIAPLYVMDISGVSVSAIGDLLESMGTAAGTEHVAEGEYTIAEFETATESKFDGFYVYVGELVNDVAVHTFSCDDVHNYDINDTTAYEVIEDSGIMIEDRVFFVDTDGKVYVAASVLAEEFDRADKPTKIYVNGKPFPIPQQ